MPPMQRNTLEEHDLQGSPQVKQFYDRVGWRRHESGESVDRHLFGSRARGTLQQRGDSLREERVRSAFGSIPERSVLLECGAGGHPAAYLANLFSKYVLLDFSQAGLTAGGHVLSTNGVEAVSAQGDMCHLPFPDNTYDAAFCANAIYHIPNANGQRAAFSEIMRTVKMNGVAVFVLANSRPYGFPLQLLKRVIADTPYISTLANKIRPMPPLPYKPMSLSWMRDCLEPYGSVQMTSFAMASMWFRQHVPERHIGRPLWRSMLWIERTFPRLAAFLGNYVLIVVRKARTPA
jgi:SAM-dependent methyltransferase